MKIPSATALASGVAAAALLWASPALAQTTGDPLLDTVDGSSLELDEIIVTGVATGSTVTQFESTVSVSTFDDEFIEELSPLTLSDLFAQVPGVWAETSGGGAASNVFIRGIPAPGQFLFSKIQVDGLPVFEEHGIGFLTPDGLYRNDFTTRRLESVRGGSSSVYASNAPGGIFNYISKRGSAVPEGGVQLEWGDFGHFRVDGNYAGPITDDTFFSVGGFYRVADGVRDPGFRGDEGGQLSANITHVFDRGELTVSGRYVDDRNLFLLAVPLGLDDDGDLTSIPGFDAQFDTLVSDDIADVRLLFPGGPEEFDLTEGIHNTAVSFGTEFEYDLGNGIELVNRNRYIDGETQFNTSIPFSFDDGNVVLASRLGQAQAAFGADVDSVQAVFADTGEAFALNDADGLGGQNGNGLIGTAGFFPVNSDFDNFVNELSLTKSFDLGGLGEHDVTASLYTSFYSIEQFQTFGTFLQEITGSPRNLDLVAFDGDTPVGTLTQNGFDSFSGGFFQNYEGDGEVYAFVLSDSWEVTDALRIDGGGRFETSTLDGSVEVPGVFDLSDRNDLLTVGSLPTSAADAVTFGTGQFSPFSESYSEWAWTLGANYTVTEQASVFARVSDGNRTPTLDDLASAGPAGSGDIPVGELLQVEGGVKLDLPYLQAFVTGFFSDVDNQPFTEPVNDVNGQPIDATIIQSSQTYGVEVEAELGPFYGASVNVRGTFQDPELDGLAVSGGGLAVNDAFLDGNQVPRIPETIIIVRPRYEFNTASFGLGGREGLNGSIFANIYNVGDRFSDFSNTVELPGYTTVGVGARLEFAEGFHIGANYDNITNTIGLTEGNPRSDLFAPAGADVTTATFGRPVVGRNFRVNVGYRF